MKELYIKNLCIEITRRCNMRCAHCMRGNAEAVDISLRHITNLLRHVRYIHHNRTRHLYGQEIRPGLSAPG